MAESAKKVFTLITDFDPDSETIPGSFGLSSDALETIGKKVYDYAEAAEDKKRAAFTDAIMDFADENSLNGSEFFLLATLGLQICHQTYLRKRMLSSMGGMGGMGGLLGALGGGSDLSELFRRMQKDSNHKDSDASTEGSDYDDDER